MATLLADVDGDTNAFVAVVLDRLDFSLSHRDCLAETFAHFALGGARAAFVRVLEHLARKLFQSVEGIGKVRVGHELGIRGTTGWRRRFKVQERALS